MRKLKRTGSKVLALVGDDRYGLFLSGMLFYQSIVACALGEMVNSVIALIISLAIGVKCSRDIGSRGRK